MSDSVQKSALKRNLLDHKIIAKSVEYKKRNQFFLNRDKECKELEELIPEKLETELWRIVANPRGIGKSWLVQEWAARRKEFSVKEAKKIGPVLFTDLSKVTSDEHLTQSLVCSLDPFFLNIDFLKPFPFMNFKLSDADKLKLFQKVAEELAEEKRPVVWIFDSINVLVKNGLENKLQGSQDMRRAVTRLFEMKSYLIPVPVASSSTLHSELFKLSPHIELRTGWFYPSFESSQEDLVKLVKSLLGKETAAMVADCDIKDAVDHLGDNLLGYKKILMKTTKGFQFREALSVWKKEHKDVVMRLLHVDKPVKEMSLLELKVCVMRFDLLQRIAAGETVLAITQGMDQLLGPPEVGHQSLLRRHEEYVKFVTPGTAEILRDKDIISQVALAKKALASVDASE